MKVFTFATAILLVTLIACKSDPIERMPRIDLLLQDSFTIVNTAYISNDSRTMLIHFDSDCLACQKETEAILRNIDAFAGILLVFITIQNIKELRKYSNYFKFNKFQNIIAGLDYKSNFPKHFNTYLTPYVVIYDKDQKLEGIIEGGGDIRRILDNIKITGNHDSNKNKNN